jgi:hypothetical protein
MALGLNTKLLTNPDDDENKKVNLAKDLALAPLRGVEGAAQSIYKFTDFALGDALPDYDNRFLGKSETIAGGLVEGVTQFLVPFGGIAKGVKAASSIGRFGKQFTRLNKKGKEVLNWKGVIAAETATDFIAFDAQEERLSNLINTFPSLRNPVTDFLEADGDDGEIEGRFKNSLEGLGITGLATGLIGGLRAMKLNRQKKDGAGYLRNNQTAFKQKTFGEASDYDVYSPSLRAVDRVTRKSVPPKNIIQELSKTGERGVAEELKWMGFDDPSDLPLNAKGQVDVAQLKEAIEERQLQTTLVEQRPHDEYRSYKQTGGENYREFTVETTSHANYVDYEKKKLTARGDYNPHYDAVASREDRSNLLHFRTTDRTTKDGKQILQIEELQSDYIQSVKKAKREGVKSVGKTPLEDSYISSAMRQIVQMAAKEGYDSVSFPKGVAVADLYSHKLDTIKVNAVNEDGSKSFRVQKYGHVKDVVVKNKKELENYFGKTAADELDAKPEGWEAEDYNVGVKPAPFMQQYDEKMPAALKRLGASFGTKSRVEDLKIIGKREEVDKMDALRSFLGEDESGQSYMEYGLEDIIYDNAMDGMRVVLKSGNKKMTMDEFVFTLRDDVADRMGERYGDDMETDGLIDDNAVEFMMSKEFDKRYQFIRGGDQEGRQIAQEAHIIDINKDMSESVTKGVSLWGQKETGSTRFGNQINDPELRSQLGVSEAESYNIVKAMAKEAKGKATKTAESVVGRGATVGFAVDRLVEAGTTPEVRKGFAALKKLNEGNDEFFNTDIELYFSNQQAGDFNPFDPRTGRGNIGLYTARTGVFEGKVDPKQVFSEATLFHEMVHTSVVTKIPVEISAVNRNLKGEDYLSTVAAMSDDVAQPEPLRKILKTYMTAVENAPEQFKNIRGSLNDIDGYAKQNADSVSEWYGLSNVDEFLAESLSNKKFQAYLRGIEGTGGKNLFDELLTFLKELIGVEGKGTALEDVVTAYSDLVSKSKKRYRAIDYTDEAVSRMFPTRSSFAFKQIHEENRNKIIKTAFGEATVDFDGVKRGGEAAVKGVGKSLNQVETTNDLGTLIAETERAVDSQLTANPKLNPASLEAGGIAAAVNRFSELTGTDKDFIMSEVNAAGKDAGELRRIAARMYTVESLALGQTDTVFELAEKLKDKGTAVTDIDKAQLVGEIKKLVSITAAGSNLRRGFGQGLQSTQFKRTRLSLNEVELRNQEIVNEYMANNLGTQNFDVLLNRILFSADPDDAIRQMMGLTSQARKADPNGYMEKAQNWYINSLLSGPRTFMKNAIGNMVAQTLLQVETAVGGVFVNPAITRHVMKEFATLESFREGMDFFLKAYKLDDQLLDTGRSPLENTAKTHRPEYFADAAPEQTMRQAFNWFGNNVVNIPTKLLLSMDEVFKQSLFRQNAKLELTLKGMKMGIKNPDELADYVARGMETVMVNGERAFSNTGIIKYANDAVEKMDAENLSKGGKRLLPSERAAKVQEIIDGETAKRGDALKKYEDGGLGFENLGEIDNVAARSLEHARYGTFTNDAGKSAELAGAIVKTIPVLKLIFPFIRTPINLLKFSFDRAFFAGPEVSRQVLANMPDLPMLKNTQATIRKELNSRNPVERARAAGKIATASMMNASLLYMILSNRDFITSGGPKDTAQLKTLEQTGWQRYSFRVGDKYFSYSGLDPFGTHFGVLADLVDQFDEANSEINSTVAEQVFAAATISMTRNITDKSYLAGLQLVSDALSNPERKMAKLVNNLAGGFVPNILYQGQSLGGDTTTREVRNLGDALLKKLPNGNDALDPKRNLLGEPITVENYPIVGPFNPSRISTRKGDEVFEELANLEHGFTNPPTKLDRLIDLTDYKKDTNQSAYDRQLELLGETKIRGKSLRQSLEKLIRDKRYQRLSTISEGGVKSPRIALINRIISRYRRVAFVKMLEEFPEVKDKYMQIRQAKVVGKSGGSEDVITNLLNLNE